MSDLQDSEPRFLQLHDELVLTGRQLHQWATSESLARAMLLDPSKVHHVQLVHYRHHYPMSWLTVQLSTGEQVELVVPTDAKLQRQKPKAYPQPYDMPWATWTGVALGCPDCGLVSTAPGLDPDDDPVGPHARAMDLFRRHWDLAHRGES